MYPRRGLMGGRGMSGGFNQVPRSGPRGRGGGGGGGGGGGLLGSLGPRDGSAAPTSFTHGQPRMGRGYHNMPFHRSSMAHSSQMSDPSYATGMMQMSMNKRAGQDISWESKRHRPERTSDLGFNRRGGRGREGSTEYDPSRPTEDSGQEFFCRLCKISCWDEESMERHMSGKKHQAVVDTMRRPGSNSAREYCSTCGKWIDGSFEIHKGSREHLDKTRRKSSGPAATKSDTSVVESTKTNEDDSTETKEETSSHKDPVKKDPVISPAAEKNNSTKEKTESTPKETEKSNGDVAASLEEEQEGSVEDEYAVPEYDEKVCFGREYVVPVSGYFCRLCHKFYSSETTAYDTHCHSRLHYDKYSAALEDLRTKRNDDAAVPVITVKQPRGRGIRRGNTRP